MLLSSLARLSRVSISVPECGAGRAAADARGPLWRCLLSRLSPDGKSVVSGSYDETVRLCNAPTGAPLQTLEGYSASVDLVAYFPDLNQ